MVPSCHQQYNKAAVGNVIALDSDLAHFLVYRAAGKSQRKVCDRVKDMENIKARDATSGNSKEVYHIDISIL